MTDFTARPKLLGASDRHPMSGKGSVVGKHLATCNNFDSDLTTLQ